MTLLFQYGWLGVIFALWVGLCVGSFLNVVIYRYPIMLQRDWRAQAKAILSETSPAAAPESAAEDDPDTDQAFNLMVPRSQCPSCSHQIRAWENIPVLSWLFLRGKCAHCSNAISARYPIVELLTGLATLWVLHIFGFTLTGYAACGFTWMLIAAFGIDYDTKLLPDQITYPLLWMGLLLNLTSHGLVPIPDAVIGAAAGYLFLWSIYWAFKLLTGKEGMGYGDFKLFAALGAWMGWQTLASIILLAALLGLAYAVFLIVTSRQKSADPIPFGPFLATAGWTTLLYREEVLGLLVF